MNYLLKTKLDISKALKFLLIIVFWILIPHATFANEQIGLFDATYVINADGTVSVTEKIIYNFDNEQRHGYIRDIDYQKVNEDGKKFNINITDISVIDELGKTYKYTTTKNDNYYSIKIGDLNKTITGIHTYVIKYKMHGALTYFSDHDEFYWTVTGDQQETPIIKTTAHVILPAINETTGIRNTCFTGVINSETSACTSTQHQNIIDFQANTQLNPRETITIGVAFPSGYVDILEPQSAHENIFIKIVSLLVTILVPIASLYWYIIYPIKVFIKWQKDAKNNSRARITSAWFDPPKDEFSNAYTPAETGTLIDKTVDIKDITATIIHLCQRGFLKLKETSKNKYTFIKCIESGISTNLKPFEKTLLSGIFAKGDETTLDSLKNSTAFYQIINSFNTQVLETLVTNKLFVENPKRIVDHYDGITALAVLTVNIPLFILAAFFARKSALRSDIGVEKFGEAKSLKNFLVSQDAQLDFQAKNQMFFEKLLAYATAFGVEDIWAKRFADLQFSKPDWYDGDDFNVASFGALAKAINNNIQVTSRAGSTSSHSTSGFSSGFSHGHVGGGGGSHSGGRSW